MNVNRWKVILTTESLVVESGSERKEYSLDVYLKDKKLVSSGEAPTIAYDSNYKILKLYPELESFKVLNLYFEGIFKDFQKNHVRGLLSSIVKPRVDFYYSRAIHEQFLGFEKGFIYEAIDSSRKVGVRRIDFHISN